MAASRIVVLLLVLGVSMGAAPLEWRNLPALPEPLGLGGPFAGVSGGALIVAGGANFPAAPSQGGVKQWSAAVHILESPDSAWQSAAALPHPLAYGGSVSYNDSVILAGGSDATRHYAEVWRLTWNNGSLEQRPLPSLPHPIANTAAALLNNVLYLAGGQQDPTSPTALNIFWSLDLSQPGAEWRQLDPWPGPARILPAMAAQDGAVFLFSGAELITTPEGQVSRRFLSDAYRYDPVKGWTQAAPPPHPIVAAPTLPWGQSHIVIFSGDDGENFFRQQELGESHPGFPKQVLAYHAITDTWVEFAEMPAGRVTTTAVRWRDMAVIPSGEDRPAHRSPDILAATFPSSAQGFSSWDYAALALYLAAIVAVGVHFARKETTTEDFFLAGRRIPWWAAGLSIFGTQLSSISFMATPAKVYATDWVYWWNLLAITLVAPIVVYFYLPVYRRLNITTIYEYLELRFNLAARLLGSLTFILFQIGRMAVVLYLPAIALSAVTGINVYVSVVVMGALATIYTVLGGIEAVIWTDVAQVIVLIGGAILSLFVMAANVDGGFSGVIETGLANNKFHLVNWTWDMTTTALWIMVLGNIFVNLVSYTSDQVVAQRYLTTKDEKQAARSVWTNGCMTLPASFLWFGLGTALYVFYKAQPERLDPSIPTDAIFPFFVSRQLPPGVAGLVVAGLFAAAMSTLDSSLNSVATTLVTDFYRRFRPLAPDAACMRLARRLTAGLGVFATATAALLAASDLVSVWDTYQKILGLLGGGMAGMFMLGIFTRRATAAGAIAGALVSAAVLYLVQTYTQVHFFLYAAIGVVVCLTIGYGVSLAKPAGKPTPPVLTIYSGS